MSDHYYQRRQELAGIWREAFGEDPSVRFAIAEAVDALEAYANLGGDPYDQDAQDAIDAAEEYLTVAFDGMEG